MQQAKMHLRGSTQRSGANLAHQGGEQINPAIFVATVEQFAHCSPFARAVTVDDEINVPLVLVLDQPNGRLAPVQHPNIAALQKIQLVKEHLSLTLRTHTAICNNTLLTSKKAQVALTGGCQAVRAVTRALRWRQQRGIDAEQAPFSQSDPA